MRYSQNNEQEIIEQYFGDFVGVLLDMGCNDGKTLSNSYHLLKNKGWKGILVDASDTCIARAKIAHDNRQDIQFLNIGLADKNGPLQFNESGAHFNNGDVSLLSSFIPEEIVKWRPTTTFTTKTVECYTFQTFYETMATYKTADYITIDVEGLDYQILTAIDLNKTGTRLVCVEHNSKDAGKYIEYCARFGMRLISQNGENLILAR